MVGQVALQDHLARHVAAPGAARHLGQELERALGRAEVGQAEAHVGVDHAHQRHARKVVALRDHLGADQDVGLPRLERGQRLRHHPAPGARGRGRGGRPAPRAAPPRTASTTRSVP